MPHQNWRATARRVCVITKECRFHSMTLHKSVILYTSINVRAVGICMVSRMARNALYRTFLCRFAINVGEIGAILTGFALIIGAAKLSIAFCVPRIDQARRIGRAVPIPYRYTILTYADCDYDVWWTSNRWFAFAPNSSTACMDAFIMNRNGIQMWIRNIQFV